MRSLSGFRHFKPERATVAALKIIAILLSVRSPSLAQSGLIAAYSFNEGSGTTVADSSGNNLSGTIVGATWTTGGRYGGALSFNGTSSYVDLGNPAAFQLNGSMTIEAWVKASTNPADDGQIVAKSNGQGWALKTSPDTGPHTFGVELSSASGATVQRYSTTVRALNTWYHIAGVYDAAGQTLTTYVNGVLDNGILRGTVPASQVSQNLNVNIGRRSGGFYFSGIIDEVRIYDRALSQAEIQVDLDTPVGGALPPPDTTPPTVSISSPTDGASVAGTTSVSAVAADDVGVAAVQFLLDGGNLGGEVPSAPYTIQWNTVAASIGTHTLAAVARDFSGNATTSAGVSVNVSNPSPAQVGQWTGVMNWPMVAVHAELLPSGDVLAWTDYTINGGAQIWRPATNTFTPKSYTTTSLFCAGHTYMADGRLLVVGGIVGLQDDLGPQNGTIFDPVTENWSESSLMITGRYYPTATTLGDGRILVQGGTTTCVTCIADMPEIYDPVSNTWTQLAASAKMAFKYYPHPFVLPDGRVLVASEDDKAISSRVLDLNTQTWTTVDSRVFDGHSSAMYRPGRIIKAGTATADNEGFPAAATTYVLDMTQASPAWQATAPMAFPRSYLNLTILPDGNVLATGGSTTTDKANFSAAVYEAELWSAGTKTWTTMARMQTPRLYHSTALLLPDARVLVAGGGRENGRSQPDPKDEPNAEIFSPPYLFKGPRPVISSSPSLIQYNGTFSVVTPDADRVASVAILGLGTVTHAFNEHQSLVPLAFVSLGGSLNVQAPVDGNMAPPGPYMLFLVDTNGVPSVAAMVRLPAPGTDLQSPTAPGNLAAVASTGRVTLSWSASTDNVGVTLYNVYRSTTSGFAATSASKIGQTSTTGYADTSIPSGGTYYYLVTAQDAAGNISNPSNQAVATVTVDTIPPTVSLTAPAAGTSLTGVVAVTASASDNVAVAGVQFLLDGSVLGGEVTGPGPLYTFNWTTATAPNGAHTLSARARDSAGNTALAANVGVTVSNSAPSGLLAAYSFSEGSGTTVSDSSGNNIKGTIVGATWTAAGRYGSGLSFNGTSSYVDLGNPAALQLTGSMTAEAWIKAAANPPDDGEIVAKSNGTGWQLKTSPDTGPHTFAAQVSPPTGKNAQRYSTTVRALNTWYHVAGVYDASARTLSTYVNGVLDNGSLRGTVAASQVNQNVNVNIGRRTGGFYFNGVIDELRIYNRALSAAEIQSDMNSPIGSGTPPDTTAPTVSLTAPAAGASLSGTVAVTASATDNVGVVGVQFLLDGANLGAEVTGAGPSYTFNWNTTTAATGTHTLSARARDAAGNAATAATVSVSVSRDTTPPAVSLIAPADGDTLAGTVAVTASATDDVGVAGVQFLLDGANLGAEVTGAGPTYTLNWNTTTAGNGTHPLAARARDASGNTAITSSVNVTLSNTVSSGLLAAYSFNQGSGTTAADSSGNGITGTLSGATWAAAGEYGGALSFNGTSNYVDLGNPTALQNTGSMTWAAWVNATGNPPDDGQIVAKSNDASGWQFKTSPDTGLETFGVKVSGSTSSAQRYSKTVRALNTWYHVAAVYNAATATLDIYVNGVLDNGVLRGAIPSSQAPTTLNVNIGRRSGGYYFKGLIDEVRIYNRALSQAEIQTIMNTPLP